MQVTRQLAPLSATRMWLVRKTFVAHPDGLGPIVFQGMPSGSSVSILSYGLFYLRTLLWGRVG